MLYDRTFYLGHIFQTFLHDTPDIMAHVCTVLSSDEASCADGDLRISGSLLACLERQHFEMDVAYRPHCWILPATSKRSPTRVMRLRHCCSRALLTPLSEHEVGVSGPPSPMYSSGAGGRGPVWLADLTRVKPAAATDIDRRQFLVRALGVGVQCRALVRQLLIPSARSKSLQSRPGRLFWPVLYSGLSPARARVCS
jgi:hypothetical protein